MASKHFHHIGMPTDIVQEGETYVEDTRVWVTRPENHPQRIEFLRFEADTPVTGPMSEALEGEKVIIEPFSPMEGLEVAFFEKDGAVVEYMAFREGASEFSDLDSEGE